MACVKTAAKHSMLQTIRNEPGAKGTDNRLSCRRSTGRFISRRREPEARLLMVDSLENATMWAKVGVRSRASFRHIERYGDLLAVSQ
jgi:hypothetical protein